MQSQRRPHPLQELLQAASKRQIQAAAWATGVDGHKLRRFAIGATTLSPEEAQRNFLLRGKYFIKVLGGAHGKAERLRAAQTVSSRRVVSAAR